MLLLQIISKNAVEKKKKTRIDASYKVITVEKWIGTEKVKIESKSKANELKSLNKCSK